MHLLFLALFGLIVGAISNHIVPTGKSGCLPNIITGVVGSYIGGAISWALWGSTFGASGWIMSICGAVILNMIYVFAAKNQVK